MLPPVASVNAPSGTSFKQPTKLATGIVMVLIAAEPVMCVIVATGAIVPADAMFAPFVVP